MGPNVRHARLIGIELNALVYLLGATRIALSGLPVSLSLGDALADHHVTSIRRFDCVLMAPPWGVRVGQTEAGMKLPVSTNDVEAQFIQHALLSLAPGGRAVIAASRGFASRGGSEKRVRDWVIEHFRLEDVLTLPKGAFAPFAGVEGNILIVRNRPPAPTVRGATSLFPTTRCERFTIW